MKRQNTNNTRRMVQMSEWRRTAAGWTNGRGAALTDEGLRGYEEAARKHPAVLTMSRHRYW